jgi:anti-sigma factor RsiW
MNTAKRPVNEQDLQAYVDGWLPPPRHAAVEQYLEAHPEEAARIRDYRLHGEAVRAAMRNAEPAIVPERLLRATRGAATAGRGAWFMRAAAAAVLLAVGLGGGWTLRGVVPGVGLEPGLVGTGGDPMAQRIVESTLPLLATAAHRVYAVEVRHPVEVRAEEAHLMGWLSKRVGRTLSAPDLKRFGFTLMGGRLLPASGGAAAQLMYEDGNDRRISVYVEANPTGGKVAFRFVNEDGLGAFYWLDGQSGFALVGPLARDELLDLAKAVYQQIEM